MKAASKSGYWQINAFTDRAFSGNPAAVIFLPYERNDRWLQTIAREFNQTTAFVVKRYNSRNDGKKTKRKGLVQVDESGTGLKASKSYDPLPVENEFDLRWFSPSCEVHRQTFEISKRCWSLSAFVVSPHAI